LVICELAHVGFGPDGAVIVHTTFPVGFMSAATTGLAPTVAVNVSFEPGWAGDGAETSATVVDDPAFWTVIVPTPLPAP
jgi:hypothetical protein